MRKKRLKMARRGMVSTGIYLLVVFMRLFPRRDAIVMFRILARIAYYVLPTERKRTIQHLSIAFGGEKSPDEVNRLSRQVFLHLGSAASDAICVSKIMRNGINTTITIEGRTHLDHAFKSGKGAIILSCHIGNWELLGTWLARNGYKIKGIATSNPNPRLNRLMMDTRNSGGYTNIERGKNTREIIRAIKEGNFLGIMVDQDMRVDGVFVKFFDQWAHTAVGPAILAKICRCDIIPVFMLMKKDYSYHIEVQEPLKLQSTGDKEGDLIANTQTISDVYERVIRRFPEQWVWMHRRWKKQPGGR